MDYMQRSNKGWGVSTANSLSSADVSYFENTPPPLGGEMVEASIRPEYSPHFMLLSNQDYENELNDFNRPNGINNSWNDIRLSDPMEGPELDRSQSTPFSLKDSLAAARYAYRPMAKVNNKPAKPSKLKFVNTANRLVLPPLNVNLPQNPVRAIEKVNISKNNKFDGQIGFREPLFIDGFPQWYRLPGDFAYHRLAAIDTMKKGIDYRKAMKYYK